MSNIDDLLRGFRADVPGPADGAPERILERARRAHAQPDAHVGRPWRARRSSRLRWAVLPVAVAGAVSLLVALAPTGDLADPGSRIAPTLLERAEAAIAPPHRILALSVQLRRTTAAPGVVNPHQTIKMRQWSLVGSGRAMLMRVLISEGPLDRPPTDEDSTVLLDRGGRVIDQRSWTPVFVRARDNYGYPRGGGNGELEIGGPDVELQQPLPLTLAGQVRDAYRHHRLRPAGRTAGGELRLRGRTVLAGFGGGRCSRTELILDPRTFIPRSIEITDSPPPCRPGARPTSRELWTISAAESLPATTANRRLLTIGDWPTARTVRWVARGAPGKPIERVPPVPALDEG